MTAPFISFLNHKNHWLKGFICRFLLGFTTCFGDHQQPVDSMSPHPWLFKRGMRLSTSEGHFTIEAETAGGSPAELTVKARNTNEFIHVYTWGYHSDSTNSMMLYLYIIVLSDFLYLVF